MLVHLAGYFGQNEEGPAVRHWKTAGDEGYVAEREGKPVGAAWFRHHRPKSPQGFPTHLDRSTREIFVSVLPDKRRQGIGPHSAEALVQKARGDGITTLLGHVNPQNENGLRLCRELGFEKDGDRWLLFLG